jgi:tetratricopeptide (TPR) repeat protein
MIRLTVLSLLGVSLLFPRAILAQKSATIAGNVYYGSDYNPARNVTVTLYDNERTVLESQNTSDDGLFRFGGLKRATYLIGVDIAGFEPVSIDVDVSLTSDKGLAIYLKSTAKQETTSNLKTVSVHELSMPAKARELMDSGMKKLYHDKDAHAALPDFQQALALAPAYYEAAYQLGMAQLSLGDRAQAEKSFRGSFEQSKHTYGESAVALGAALLDLGNTSEAEQFIRRGLVLNPNLWLGHYELGRALLQQKRLSDALTSAEQARLLAPSVPIVYRLLSNIHLQQENYPALLADLDTYLTLDPSSPAGLRAKQLRDQLQSQAAQHAPPPPKP